MRTADEILDDELSETMLNYLKENQIFREWIKDAMYNYANEYHKSEVLKLNKAPVIKSVCDCKPKTYRFRTSDSNKCIKCGEEIE